MKARSGGGITMNKNVSPGIKTGSPSKATTPGAANQIGPAISFKREQVDQGGRGDRSPVPLGNAKALDVGKGGPGAGRTTHPSGSQNQWGPPNRGESPRSASRGLDVRGRLKGEV
jgi:hypothetical protein